MRVRKNKIEGDLFDKGLAHLHIRIVLSHKNNELRTCATTHMNLESILSSEKRQNRITYCIIPFIKYFGKGKTTEGKYIGSGGQRLELGRELSCQRARGNFLG